MYAFWDGFWQIEMKNWCAELVHLRDTKYKIQPSRTVIPGESYLLAFPFISVVQLGQDLTKESYLKSAIFAHVTTKVDFFFFFFVASEQQGLVNHANQRNLIIKIIFLFAKFFKSSRSDTLPPD